MRRSPQRFLSGLRDEFFLPLLGEFFLNGSSAVPSIAQLSSEKTNMRRVAFSIAIIASLLSFAPSIAAEPCAVGVSAIGACQIGQHRKPERRAVHPRHRVEKPR
jgi:hypothetical protein